MLLLVTNAGTASWLASQLDPQWAEADAAKLAKMQAEGTAAAGRRPHAMCSVLVMLIRRI
jgi:hypothetical protein